MGDTPGSQEHQAGEGQKAERAELSKHPNSYNRSNCESFEMPKSRRDSELNRSVNSILSWGATQQELPQHMPGAPEEQGQLPSALRVLSPSEQAAGAAMRLLPSCCGEGKAELQLCMALCSHVWWAGSPEATQPSPSLTGS